MAQQTILIVEDDPIVSSTLSSILRRSGYDTLVAADAVSCVAEAKNNLPDLILLDLGLHTAGDGFVVMHRLQNLSSVAGIPIVVISAQERALVERRAIESGAVAFFQKPVNVAALLRRILGLVQGRQSARLGPGGASRFSVEYPASTTFHWHDDA